ncbi:hypothetical protein JAAARDRAFT_644376 [Jaapia argillacea MUCL 33604]|uniref:Protein kinase domain-containing protein n=1 Tax=Jaapia argillacea MUCL 33604 TaxID=933084 RepID=A0A067P363_9AGAM|nr:hypothetical protein JAAARDRAFT_644376 [Jaapia argillacea MUCL 33604]
MSVVPNQSLAREILRVCDIYAHRLDRELLDLKIDRGSVVQSLRWFGKLGEQLGQWANTDSVHLLLQRESVHAELCRLKENMPQHMYEVACDVSPWPLTLDASTRLHPQADLAEELKNLTCWILSTKKSMDVVRELSSEELQMFLDHLDDILGQLWPDTFDYSQCLCVLRQLCRMSSMLPKCVRLEGEPEKSTESYTFGGICDIFKGTYRGETVAIKILRSYDSNKTDRINKMFFQEAVTWKRLSHQNIVPFRGVSQLTLSPDREVPCLISTWMDRGNILEFLEDYPSHSRIKLLLDCANGLYYLHSVGLLYRELRAANILINDRHQACLYDFTRTSLVHDQPFRRSFQNMTYIRWRAPELASPDAAPSLKSDVYAFAMLMLEVFTGVAPFAAEYPSDLEYALAVFPQRIMPPRPSGAVSAGLSDEIWWIMRSCWDASCRRRPTVFAIRKVLQDVASGCTPETTAPPGTDRPPSPKRRLAPETLQRSFSSPDRMIEEKAAIDTGSDRMHTDNHRLLKKLCIEFNRLPRSYMIPGGLKVLEPYPVASGAFADIFLGEYQNRQVAIKVLTAKTQNLDVVRFRKRLFDEIFVWKRVSEGPPPNIARFIGASVTSAVEGLRPYHVESSFCMISEWMKNGNVLGYLENHPAASRVCILRDVMAGLHHLHGIDVIHGDLKGTNILIDDRGHALLTDFGLTNLAAYDSDIVHSLSTTSARNGSWRWMPPERFDPGQADPTAPKGPTRSGDVYAFGLVIYEVYSDKLPFDWLEEPAVPKVVMEGGRPPRPDEGANRGLSDALWHLAKRCWSQCSADRPDLASVLRALSSECERQRGIR